MAKDEPLYEKPLALTQFKVCHILPRQRNLGAALGLVGRPVLLADHQQPLAQAFRGLEAVNHGAEAMAGRYR